VVFAALGILVSDFPFRFHIFPLAHIFLPKNIHIGTLAIEAALAEGPLLIIPIGIIHTPKGLFYIFFAETVED
jgi:hypothetical protein